MKSVGGMLLSDLSSSHTPSTTDKIIVGLKTMPYPEAF